MQNQKLVSDSVLEQSTAVSRVQHPTVASRVQEFRYAVKSRNEKNNYV